MYRRLIALVVAALFALMSTVPAFADSPFVGNSGNFSGATCPSPNNPHCPPQGG